MLSQMEYENNLNDFRYLVFQLELSASGTYHLQGYIEFHSPQRMTRVKALLSNRVHCEQRRGTRDQAREYCMKEDTRILGPCEIGTWNPSGQGCRKDLSNIQDMFDDGSSMLQVAKANFGSFCRYHKGFTLYKQMIAGKRHHLTEIFLYIGPPGVGKSKYVSDLYPDAYWKPPGNNWWPLYDGEEDVVFDEFSGSWFSVQALLRLGDRYPLMTDVKGGHCQFLAKRIHITCNSSIRAWYDWNNVRSPITALERRITKLFASPNDIYEVATTSSQDLNLYGGMTLYEHPDEFPFGWQDYVYQ